MHSLMSLEFQVTLTANITLAMILSSAIGINRERSHKSAGMRTHMLTGTGACIFTILSLYAFPYADTSRIASNVLTGIGFLGGGIIIQRKNAAYDLTTAAGVWATAAIGMAVGAGAWFIAVYSTVLLWIILALFKHLKFESGDENGSSKKSSKKNSESAPEEAPIL